MNKINFDPCEHGWLDDDIGSVEYENWLDEYYENYAESIDIALNNYECGIYNELDRRSV
jgi:hypothetical protein